jgi:hypothetical protein
MNPVTTNGQSYLLQMAHAKRPDKGSELSLIECYQSKEKDQLSIHQEKNSSM